MAIKVEEYLTEERKNHYSEWFNDLPIEYASKVAVVRARMMAGSLGNVKYIDGTFKEFGLIGGRGYQHTPARLRGKPRGKLKVDVNGEFDFIIRRIQRLHQPARPAQSLSGGLRGTGRVDQQAHLKAGPWLAISQ